MSYILKKIHFLLLFLCISVALQAQSFKAFNKAGDKAFAEKDYHAAMHYYANALDRKPDDAGTAYKYAEVALQFQAFEKALEYYEQVASKGDQKAFPELNYKLGLVHQSLGNYEEAKKYYTAYSGSRYKEDVRTAVESIDWALELLQNPDPYQVEQLNKRVNTAYSEFGALQRGDTLYYSSYRFENKEDKHVPPRKITKILTSLKGSRGRQMRRNFNDEEKHTAHTTFSLNSQRIYFTKCEYLNASEIRCAIYYKEKDRRKRWKRTAVKLPEQINRTGFTTTHPQISYDSMLQAEVLYFVSDRPEGKGGLDIWRSSIDENGKFTEPEALEAINTSGNDITPYFVQETQVLYYSSDHGQTLGGYDIFNWNGQEISHMGVPLNSSYNDVYFTVDAEGKKGYFSSNRPGSFYLDAANKACCNDIYKFEYIEPKAPEEDSIVITEKPTPAPIYTDPEPAQPIMPSKLEDFLPLALYFDNDEPDKRTRRTSTKKTYEETYLRYYKAKSTYLREFTTDLEEDNQAEAELAVETFFEDKVKKGYDFLFRFSEILLERLEAGEEVEIFIKGYTSPRAKSDYNLSLGKRRISSLRNHFDTYKNGIFLPYLEKNQLKVTERSFGETEASTEVSDALEDTRNSIYSPDAARERRVEIVEIKRKD